FSPIFYANFLQLFRTFGHLHFRYILVIYIFNVPPFSTRAVCKNWMRIFQCQQNIIIPKPISDKRSRDLTPIFKTIPERIKSLSVPALNLTECKHLTRFHNLTSLNVGTIGMDAFRSSETSVEYTIGIL